MTIKALYPSIRPTLNLDFAKTKALDPRVTFTRASTATFVGADGLIKTAASGAARFDHGPVTGESLGLLVEEARTNNVLYSEQFDNAYWGKVDITVTANSIASPDGTTTADSLVLAANTSVKYTIKILTVSNATAYTLSVFLKRGVDGPNWYQIQAGNSLMYVNLATGAVGATSGLTGSSVVTFPNGWYKITLSFVSTGTTAEIYPAIPRNGSNDNSAVTGTGGVGAYIWGIQFEQGAFATSYIPTTSATVTRAADVANMTGTNFSSWYNQSQGTWLINFANDAAKQGAFRGVLSLGANNTPRIQGNSVVGYGGSLNFTPTAVTKAGLAYGSTEGRAVNGTVASGAGGTIDTETSVDIGTGASSSPASYMLSTSIARLAYYPVRLSDTQLQALTAT